MRELAATLCATCEVIEGVDDAAASAAVDLSAIVTECDLIASADEFACEDAPEDAADVAPAA